MYVCMYVCIYIYVNYIYTPQDTLPYQPILYFNLLYLYCAILRFLQIKTTLYRYIQYYYSIITVTVLFLFLSLYLLLELLLVVWVLVLLLLLLLLLLLYIYIYIYIHTILYQTNACVSEQWCSARVQDTKTLSHTAVPSRCFGL